VKLLKIYGNNMQITNVDPLVVLLAGIVSVFSPCTLPLLPAILAFSSTEERYKPFSVILGLIISFTLMGTVTSAFGALVTGYIPYVHLIASFIIVLFGMVMFFDLQMFNFFYRFTRKIHTENQGIFGGLLLGLCLGIVWIPCVGPILGSVLVLVALEGNLIRGTLLLFIYSLGFAIPMLIIAYSANVSSMRLSIIARYNSIVKKLAGILLISMGMWMAYTSQIKLLF
jgi:cytochrome c-type biogenesis protein